ncbi:MAG: RNA methyltransferase [Bryobacteraceae bacterium]
MSEEQIPFQITTAAKAYDIIKELPVTVLLENVRSAFNVGAIFRTADAAKIERMILTGITSTPPHKGIIKTALGAENTVAWEHCDSSLDSALILRARGYEIAAIETSLHAVDIFDWVPRFPVCIAFGNEVDGVSPELAEFCDTHVRIPMLGLKHSLNVGTAGGVVLYELLRKYREIHRSVPSCSILRG